MFFHKLHIRAGLELLEHLLATVLIVSTWDHTPTGELIVKANVTIPSPSTFGYIIWQRIHTQKKLFIFGIY